MRFRSGFQFSPVISRNDPECPSAFFQRISAQLPALFNDRPVLRSKKREYIVFVFCKNSNIDLKSRPVFFYRNRIIFSAFSAHQVNKSRSHSGEQTAVQDHIFKAAIFQHEASDILVDLHIQDRFRQQKPHNAILFQLPERLYKKQRKCFLRGNFCNLRDNTGESPPRRIGHDIIKRVIFQRIVCQKISAKNIRNEILIVETQQHIEFGNHHSDRVSVDTVQQFRRITGDCEQKSSAAAAWIKEYLPILKGQRRNHLCRYFAGRIIRAILIFLPLGRTGLIDDPEQIVFILRKFSIYNTCNSAVWVFCQNSLNIGVIKNSPDGKKIFRNGTQKIGHGKSGVVQCGQYILYSRLVILIYKGLYRHDFFCRQPLVCPSGKAGTFFCL